VEIPPEGITSVELRRYRFPNKPGKPGYGYWTTVIFKMVIRFADGSEALMVFSYRALKELLREIGSGIRKIFRDFPDPERRDYFILSRLRCSKKVLVFVADVNRGREYEFECFVDGVIVVS